MFFLILIRLMQNSERLGFPIFCRSGQRETSLDEFGFEVDGWLPLLPEVHLPRLTGQLLADVVHRKGFSAGGLDGWGWTEFKVLPISWSDELARILSLVEDTGVWPDGLLDASITMIPKLMVILLLLVRDLLAFFLCVSHLGLCSYGSVG